MFKYSIVVPLHNEQENVTDLYARLKSVMEANGESFEMILVDDGSSQQAPEDFRAERLLVLRQVDVLRLRRNLGHQRAIAIGLSYIWEHVPCETIVLMDSDGEDDPVDVPRLLARYREASGEKIIFADTAFSTSVKL